MLPWNTLGLLEVALSNSNPRSGASPVPMLLLAVMNTLMTLPGGTVMMALTVSIIIPSIGLDPDDWRTSLVPVVEGMHATPLESRGQYVIVYKVIIALLSAGTGQVNATLRRLIRSKVIWVWLIMSGTAVMG